jgi:hypothetical protein
MAAHCAARSTRTLSVILIPRRTLAVAMTGAISACTWLNFLHDDDYFYRHYYADELICSIDTAIEDELRRKSPNGYLTKPYSEENWQTYWNDRIYTLGVKAEPLPATYRGPSTGQYAMYILQSRREFDLPELIPNERTTEFLSNAYQRLGSENRNSCEWLDWTSPTCQVSPAQHDPTFELNRGCQSDT